MKTKQAPNTEMNAKATDNSLPDGKYLTSPKWGYSEREVVIEGGIVCLADDSKHSFTQHSFFQVNDVIKTLPL